MYVSCFLDLNDQPAVFEKLEIYYGGGVASTIMMSLNGGTRTELPSLSEKTSPGTRLFKVSLSTS